MVISDLLQSKVEALVVVYVGGQRPHQSRRQQPPDHDEWSVAPLEVRGNDGEGALGVGLEAEEFVERRLVAGGSWAQCQPVRPGPQVRGAE
ncbi:hypothetical protein GCM10022224_050590 [Nonomuraea antimicrobica]|uniref:Uncharacterized protein n=1 Tax=Nonomuraea antimicrobica TaxID=561173 RepID=A0ABP7C5R1_9ACTN